jgi:hypothetical protein
MQRQAPIDELKMLQGFKGLASRFILTEKYISVPSAHYKLSSPLFNIYFENIIAKIIEN